MSTDLHKSVFTETALEKCRNKKEVEKREMEPTEKQVNIIFKTFFFFFFFPSSAPALPGAGGGCGLRTPRWNEESLSRSRGSSYPSRCPSCSLRCPVPGCSASSPPGATSPADTAPPAYELPGGRETRRHWLRNFSRHFLLLSPWSPVRASSRRRPRRPWGRGRAACSTEPTRTGARDVRHQIGGLPPLSQLVICSGAE